MLHCCGVYLLNGFSCHLHLLNVICCTVEKRHITYMFMTDKVTMSLLQKSLLAEPLKLSAGYAYVSMEYKVICWQHCLCHQRHNTPGPSSVWPTTVWKEVQGNQITNKQTKKQLFPQKPNTSSVYKNCNTYINTETHPYEYTDTRPQHLPELLGSLYPGSARPHF